MYLANEPLIWRTTCGGSVALSSEGASCMDGIEEEGGDGRLEEFLA